GMGTAWMTIVAAEMSGGETTGLGRMMVNYAELIRIPEIVVGMILIGVLGFAMNELLLRIERRLFRWRWEVTLWGPAARRSSSTSLSGSVTSSLSITFASASQQTISGASSSRAG